MKSSSAKSLLDDIDVAIRNIEGFVQATSLEKSYLAKFLVVYICGIYEECIENIINEMVSNKSSPEICRCIAAKIHKDFQTPSFHKTVNLLKNFNIQWGEAIENMPEKSKYSFGSIVANKNQIAHGENCNITLGVVKRYYSDSRPIIEKIDEMLL
jgi:hypothetical protein